ncbi:MAG TPA: hypothetical protein VHS55_07350 [Solirubrobacteraceae bacterium]|jgi:hypothetical protein|nr:hypothetical protein [Solirubrobacteraceae bacterium]
MHQMRDALGARFGVVLAVSAIAALGVSACGSSGSSTTATQANAAATSTTGGSGAAGSTSHNGATGPGGAARRQRFTGVRECLQKQGVQLPTRPGGGGLFLGGANLPKGVTRAQLQSAMSKCLGGGRGFLAGRPGGAHFTRSSSPRLRLALNTFAACLRKNGINVPQPNTSGNGPVFSTKGLNTASPQFKAATAKCRSALAGAFGLGGGRPRVGG